MVARFRAWKGADIKKSGKKIPLPKKENKYLAAILSALEGEKIPYSTEYRFHPVRKWRFDVVIGKTGEEIEKQKIAIEYNGGVFTGGRHTRGNGYLNDLDKINHAQIAGFRVLQYSAGHLIGKSDNYIGGGGIAFHVKSLMR